MADKSGDSTSEDFDQVIVFPDGRVLRVDPKTKECNMEGCEEASVGGHYAPPVGVCGYLGLMTNPTPYPMPYPTPYQMLYTTPCPMPYPGPYPMSHPMPFLMPHPGWPMKFKCKKKPGKEEKVWKGFISDKGRTYYYNTVTSKSQWEKPKDLDEKKKKKKPEEERPRPPQKPPRKYTNM